MATKKAPVKANAKPDTKKDASQGEKTFWLNDDQVLALVKSAKSKGLDLDQAIEKLAESDYKVGDRQVYVTSFVSKWHNHETDKSVKSFF